MTIPGDWLGYGDSHRWSGYARTLAGRESGSRKRADRRTQTTM